MIGKSLLFNDDASNDFMILADIIFSFPSSSDEILGRHGILRHLEIRVRYSHMHIRITLIQLI